MRNQRSSKLCLAYKIDRPWTIPHCCQNQNDPILKMSILWCSLLSPKRNQQSSKLCPAYQIDRPWAVLIKVTRETNSDVKHLPSQAGALHPLGFELRLFAWGLNLDCLHGAAWQYPILITKPQPNAIRSMKNPTLISKPKSQRIELTPDFKAHGAITNNKDTYLIQHSLYENSNPHIKTQITERRIHSRIF